jgi:hypothetical protein
MTQVERLVRNLCEDTRRKILVERDEAVQAVPEKVKLKDAPASVRQALAVIKRLKPQIERAEKAVKASGFRVPREHCSCEGDELSELDLPYDYEWSNRRKAEAQAKCHRRTEAVSRLQNTANVAVLGKSGADAKGLLDKLSRDLAAL